MYNQSLDWHSHISKQPGPRSSGRFEMTRNSNAMASEARMQQVASFLKKGTLTFGTCLALADEVFAQQGGGSPWTQAVQALQAAFTRPNATGLALVAIVVGGLVFAFGEGAAKRTLAVRIFGLGMAVGDRNLVAVPFPVSA